MDDTCHFCGSTEGVGYQKRDRAGVLQDACWDCVKPTQKAGGEPGRSPLMPETDLTFLDDDKPNQGGLFQ